MRIATHTYAFRDRSLDAALEAASRLGVDAIELWIGHAPDPGEASRLVAASGLAIRAIGIGGIYERDEASIARAVELARAVDAPVIVTCLNPDLAQWARTSVPEHITLCVENHWNQRVARTTDLLAVCSAAARLHAALDTGHAILAGERPQAVATRLGVQLGHVHLKEAKRPSRAVLALGKRARSRLLARPEATLPGDGSLELPALRAALERIEFGGTVSLEYEGSNPEPALRALLTQWIAAGTSAG